MQNVLDKTVDGEKIFGTSFAIKKEEWSWQGASGNISSEQFYFIASTTKLFTKAIILRLRSEGKLSLSDKIPKFLGNSITKALHMYESRDLSDQITIKHLLAHTSGLL